MNTPMPAGRRSLAKAGAPGRTRTPNLAGRSRLLCPVELRAQGTELLHKCSANQCKGDGPPAGADASHGQAVTLHRDGMWRSLVSARRLGRRGRRFESGHPDGVAGREPGVAPEAGEALIVSARYRTVLG